MFTGIIEQTGIVQAVELQGTNIGFWVSSPLSAALKVDQSLCHNGVCLTVEAIENDRHKVTAIEETLTKTNLVNWKIGTVVNLERCMQLNGRLDGHIVQGHVDCTAVCSAVVEKAGSWEYSFIFPEAFAAFVIEKGSITVNGISLTCFCVGDNAFTVAIIPYTYAYTNISSIEKGSIVNIEFDIVGKYVVRAKNLYLNK